MRLRLFTTAAALCVAVPAFAADLPSRAAPAVYAPPPIPAFSWEGFYAGVQVGYAFGHDSGVVVVPPFAAAPVFVAAVPAGFPGIAAAVGSSPSGIIGGGHVGYNWSSSSIFGGLLGAAGIIGIEGDVDGLDYRSRVDGAAFGLPAGSYGSISSPITGSVRGRLGFAFDRVLVYATGGAAFADFKTNYNVVGIGFDSFDHNRVGYTVGAGVAYAFTDKLSLRVEYRYSDYGTFTDTLVNASPVPGSTVSHRETMNRVQAGLSYSFATPAAPVVARY